MKINKDDLEKALNERSPNAIASHNENPRHQISKDEEIGFHKGALNTLVNERAELFKMIQNVEVIMQAHLKRLEELGVKIEQVK
ncbi:MAG: hypothetical protein AABX88_02365 [Nanoarchaeota archaeon]